MTDNPLQVYELLKWYLATRTNENYLHIRSMVPEHLEDWVSYCCNRGLMTEHNGLGITGEGKLALQMQGQQPLAKPRAKRPGPPRTDEKDSATKVVAALCKHHGYDNGSVTNSEPATNRGLAELWPGLADNALTRFLGDADRGGYKRYKAACQDSSVGMLLRLWRGEMPSRMAGLLPTDASDE